MKAIRLTVKNIGIVADAVVELNKPLLLFYGEIRQGKTTLLNAVKWVFGGSFPTDIIRRGETEAMIQLDLDTGVISRTFYVARDGGTKARPLMFARDGIQVKDAVAEVRKFLNPFLLDQDYLRNMSELERKKYFASMFAADTASLNEEIAKTEADASTARQELKAYGDIDLSPVEVPKDLNSLKEQRAAIVRLHQENQQRISGDLANRRAAYIQEVESVAAQNRLAEEANRVTADFTDKQAALRISLAKLKAQVEQEEASLKLIGQHLEGRTARAAVLSPAVPDTTALESELAKAADTAAIDALIQDNLAQQVKREQYEKNLQRKANRDAVEAVVLEKDRVARELRANRIAKLKEASEKTGIPSLEFDEAGNFSYEGCQAGMLSTSQLMELSSLLSAKYPEGFGIDLIDRAESLGRSVFEFVDRAKAENKTILAAIVGEKPAAVPAEIGVFVVEDGVVK